LNGSIPFGKKTLIMGIVNMSPDSFYGGSRILGTGRGAVREAVDRALRFEEWGADIVDIGGESTRPGSRPISVEEELGRIYPVIDEVRKRTGLLVSVDTYKTEVALRVLSSGIHILNNITGLSSPYSEGLGELVAASGVYIVLMHMRGTPFDMQSHAAYDDVMKEISDELDESVQRALAAGIDKNRIIIDPGIGFAKSAEHNLDVLRGISLLKRKGWPVLIGLSRKSFIGRYTGLDTDDRLIPTVAANAISIFQGADIIRVHDVKEAVVTARIADAIRGEPDGSR